MLGLTCFGNQKLQVQEYPTPKAKDRKVVVKVRSSGVCGSDMRAYHAPQKKDVILGHEVSGEIFEVDKSKKVKVGDRVCIYTTNGCGKCEYCSIGLPILCSARRSIGSNENGGDAEYLSVHEDCCFILPDEVGYDEGALLFDMLGTPSMAVQKARVSSHDIVTIFGAGPIGLSAALVCKSLKAKVVMVEKNSYRIKLAKKIGVDNIVNADAGNVVKGLFEALGKDGSDVAFDCTPDSVTVSQALEVAKKRGRVMLIGEKASALVNPSNQFIKKQLRVEGCWYCNSNDFGVLLEKIRNKIDIKKIVTHHFKLKEAPTAFELFDPKNCGKVILNPWPSGG